MPGDRAGRPLRVWVLSDGQPGHYNLSRGIVGALRQIRPVDESWVKVKLRFGLARNLLRFYLNRVHKPAPLKLLRLFYRISGPGDQACDLIVSAGGKTSFINAWMARRMGVANVYAGSLRRLSSRLFTVVLTLEPIQNAASNLVVTLPPSGIDCQDLHEHAEHLRRQHGLAGQRLWCVMAGGNGAGYRYGQEDWRNLAVLMNRLGDEYGVRWLLVSSRRTGKAAEQVLKEELDAGVLAATCWYGAGDAYRAEAYLGAAERTFVTEDSMTMLSEAIHSRRPVYSLRPQYALPTERYAAMIQGFADRGYLCRYALMELLQQPELLEKQQCQVLEESPLLELGEQLGKRLGLA